MYRSVIFYTTVEQQELAEAAIRQLEADHTFASPIVTAIEQLFGFYPAEEYHRNFYDRNQQNPYCQVIISPKIAKLRQKFAHLLKEV